ELGVGEELRGRSPRDLDDVRYRLLRGKPRIESALEVCDAVGVIGERRGLLRAEVAEERTRGDAGLGRDHLDRRRRQSALLEQPDRGLGDHQLALLPATVRVW